MVLHVDPGRVLVGKLLHLEDVSSLGLPCLGFHVGACPGLPERALGCPGCRAGCSYGIQVASFKLMIKATGFKAIQEENASGTEWAVTELGGTPEQRVGRKGTGARSG